MASYSNSVIILVGGGHAAGKKTVCEKIKANVLEISTNPIEIEILDLDTYGDGSQSKLSGPARFNFSNFLKDLEEVEKRSETKKLILIAGLYSLYDKRLRSIASMKLFIDCDADTRLSRWITQDTLKGKTPLAEILENYLNRARPEFNEFIFPTKEYADVILPSDEETSGISLICDGIEPLFCKSSSKLSPKTLYPRYDVDSSVPHNPLNLQVQDPNRYYDLS